MKTKPNRVHICLLAALLLPAFTSIAQPVTKIAAGYDHSLFLKAGGSLWGMGWNPLGGLGDGTANNTNRPEQIVASNVTAIAAADYHSLFIKNGGSLWAMGYNDSGQLGDGTFDPTNRPELIVSNGVTAVAAGVSHSLFLMSNGSLWAMGNNDYGQLGDNTFNPTNRPELIVSSNVTAIAAGTQHSLFLMSDGSLWGMGYNRWGALGDGTTNNLNHPEQIVASKVTAIAAGFDHSLFLQRDGSLWAMGENSAGQLGNGIFNTSYPYGTNQPQLIVASNVTAIAAGAFHSLLLKNDGSLWATGDNRYGQLGDGIANTSYPYGTNQPQLIVASNVTAISGGHHTLFLKSDGSLWAMGDNFYGQLGDGTFNNTNRPEQILAPYNRISAQFVGGGKVQLSFVGIAGGNYALDRSFTLAPPNWLP
jgi:alpha-tubulin suppressor-like RCC1 family protein